MTAPKDGIQRLLTASGYYKGRVDGVWGNETLTAARKITVRHPDKIIGKIESWPADRIIIAAAQLVLHFTGNEPGGIDGLWGHNSQNAYTSWLSTQSSGSPIIVERKPVENPPIVKSVFPKQSECPDFYGAPGLPGTSADKAMQARLVKIRIPFTFRLDYDLDTPITSIRLHAKCAESAEEAYERVFQHYGKDRMISLGLDRFAGSYNPRKMRGGSSWSMHAFGCAIDTYAAPNGLHDRKPKALFSRPEYDAWFDIWQQFGWVPLGRAIDRDYMHVQAARL